jgi:hypothetical protein
MLLFAHVGLALASARFFSHVSLAFLALGSMLSDIVDKPLGLIVFGSPSMGRTVAHTLLLSGLKNPGILVPEITGLAYLIFFAHAERRQASAWIDHPW